MTPLQARRGTNKVEFVLTVLAVAACAFVLVLMSLGWVS